MGCRGRSSRPCVAKTEKIDTDDDGTVDTTTRTDYHVDKQNHTGYAQVLEEMNGATGEILKSYTFGLDAIEEAVAASQIRRLLKDGHGSTRQLVDATGAVINSGTAQVFAYDAYGVPIGFTLANALTALLYSGEMTDQLTNLQYLRARYYNPATGTFNRLDPFAGNFSDPQSLHKYLYTHGDPVNGWDPSGMLTMGQVMVAVKISMAVGTALGGTIGGIAGGVRGAVLGAVTGFIVTPLVTLAVMFGGAYVVAPLLGVSQLTGIFITHTTVTALFTALGIRDFANAETARERWAIGIGLVAMLSFWGIGARGYFSARAGRGTFVNRNPAATDEEIAAGRLLADKLRLDLVAKPPTGSRGPGTADYAIRTSSGKTIELKTMTGRTSEGSVVGDVLHAQGEEVAIVVRAGAFSDEFLDVGIARRVFGFQGSSYPKQRIYIVEENGTALTIRKVHVRQ